MDSNTKQKPINIRGNDGRTVARLIGETLVKITTTAGFLRNPPSFALDMVTLHEATQKGGKWLEVTNKDNGKVYRAALADYFAVWQKVDRGQGQQLALLLTHFSIDGQPPQAKAERQPAEAEQLSLLK